MSISNWQFKTTDKGLFVWEALNRGGEILGQCSQQFKSKSGCQYNADLLGRSGSFSSKLEWFFENTNSGWTWHCDNTVNKENVGASHKAFGSEMEAKQNATLFGYNGGVMEATKIDVGSDSNSGYFGSNINKAGAVGATAVGVGSIAKNFVGDETEPKAEVDADYNGNNSGSYGSGSYNPKLNTKVNMDNNMKASAINSTTTDDEGFGLGFLKWLLPLLLLLALLWWLIPMFMTKPVDLKVNTPNTPEVMKPKFDYKTALSAPNLSLFSGLVGTAGLAPFFSSLSPATILAPTNDAINKVPADIMSKLSLPNYIPQLQNIIKTHIIPGNINLKELTNGSTVTTTDGNILEVKVEGESLSIGGANIDLASYDPKKEFNTLTVDGVIVPNSVMSALESSDQSSSSVEIASSISVSSISSASSTDAMMSKSFKEGNALDIAQKSGKFGTLIKAINAAELATVLDGDGPFTIFAPTDEALAIVPNLGDFLKPENKTQLQAFLKQHVVSGKNSFEDFRAGKTLTTLAGTTIKINTNNTSHEGQVEGPKNTTLAPVADIVTNNAIIHTLTTAPIL